MNSLEKKMIESLIDLRENHYALGVKTEFEEEGASFEEAIRLKEMASCANLDLTIKIGGCKALKEMYEAKEIGVNAIVAPMIESSYAAKSYINSLKTVFSQDEIKNIKILINIETITGYKNFDEILQLKEARDLSGIVFGRGDMINSMNLTKDCINSEQILQMASNLATKTLKFNKEFIIGGSVSTRSLKFFKKLSESSLNKIETRKIIFDAQKLLKSENAQEGILKAIDFELMWIKNKRDFYGIKRDEDDKRLIILENCYKKSVEGKVK